MLDPMPLIAVIAGLVLGLGGMWYFFGRLQVQSRQEAYEAELRRERDEYAAQASKAARERDEALIALQEYEKSALEGGGPHADFYTSVIRNREAQIVSMQARLDAAEARLAGRSLDDPPSAEVPTIDGRHAVSPITPLGDDTNEMETMP